jgi:hypothetical protein
MGLHVYTTVARLGERKGKERRGDETRKEEPAAGEHRAGCGARRDPSIWGRRRPRKGRPVARGDVVEAV